MHTKIEKRGTAKSTFQMFIASLNESEIQGAVSHPVGSDEVEIRSTEKSWGVVPVKGKEQLRLLRDAMIIICEMEGIE